MNKLKNRMGGMTFKVLSSLLQTERVTMYPSWIVYNSRVYGLPTEKEIGNN